MKSLIKKVSILITALIICLQISYGQVVLSSCTAPDSIIDRYIEDSYRLVLRRILADSITYQDSIDIPKKYVDTMLNALIAVYNATDLPARDTVVNEINMRDSNGFYLYPAIIHTWEDFSLNEFYIQADTNLYWMKEYKKGNTLGGHMVIDSMVLSYNFKLKKYIDNNKNQATVYFKSDSNFINTIAWLNSINIDTITGVTYAYPSSSLGDGFNIYGTIFTKYVELIYYYGWGDCLVGCTHKRFWKFRVYYNCSVEFVDSYGSEFPVFVKIKEIFIDNMNMYVSPNPFTERIIINNHPPAYNYSIFNISGKTILVGESYQSTIYIPDWFAAGMYFINIKYKDTARFFKIVKN